MTRTLPKPPATTATSIWPTSATRRATPSTCWGCWWTRAIVDRRKIGVTGISYGGGQSIELALLRDRIRRPDDAFEPWRSPDGSGCRSPPPTRAGRVRTSSPRCCPTGSSSTSAFPARATAATRLASRSSPSSPGCSRSAQSTGYYCGEPPSAPPCDDEEADITAWYARVLAGEPPDDERPGDRRRDLRAPPGLRAAAGRPAPLLLQSGWTDDLFPARESLRIYNALRDRASPRPTWRCSSAT